MTTISGLTGTVCCSSPNTSEPVAGAGQGVTTPTITQESS